MITESIHEIGDLPPEGISINNCRIEEIDLNKEPLFSANHSIVIEPKEGDIARNPGSPSGYSIWKLGQWIPLVVQAKKKKKKKPKIYGLKEEKSLPKLPEINYDELNNRLQSYIAQRLLVIESDFGYALVAKPTTLTVHTYIENGAGFQPFEEDKVKTFIILYLICFGHPPAYGPLALNFIENHTNQENIIYCLNEAQIDSFVSKDSPKK